MSVLIKNVKVTGSRLDVDLEVPVTRLVPSYVMTFTQEDAKRIGVPWEHFVKTINEVLNEIEVKNEANKVTQNEQD